MDPIRRAWRGTIRSQATVGMKSPRRRAAVKSQRWATIALTLVVGALVGAAPRAPGEVAEARGSDGVAARPPVEADVRVSKADSFKSPSYVLNGHFLILNMHGFLFQNDPRDFRENVVYAQWMHAG